MIISSPEPAKQAVNDYDFWFQNGQVMSISINAALGDTIDFTTHPLAVMVHLASKPSSTNPEAMLPAEDITIFMSHVLTILKKTREVKPLTPEQQLEWKKTLQEVAKTIQ